MTAADSRKREPSELELALERRLDEPDIELVLAQTGDVVGERSEPVFAPTGIISRGPRDPRE